MAGHTPGPWEYVQDRAIARVESRRKQTNVVGSVGPHRHGGEEEKRANARLIAASPRLLAALKEAVTWDSHDSEGEPAVWLQEALDAIAEAEGDQ